MVRVCLCYKDISSNFQRYLQKVKEVKALLVLLIVSYNLLITETEVMALVSSYWDCLFPF